MRKRNGAAADKPGAKLTGKDDEVWGSFFGQSAFSRVAVVSRASVSFTDERRGEVGLIFRDRAVLQCVKVPDDTDLKLFAPLGCGLQTGCAPYSLARCKTY